MSKPIEHYVFLVFDRKAFTEEMRERILTLGDKACAEYGGVIAQTDVFAEDDASETIALASYWLYENEEAKDRFLKSPTHLEHLDAVKPAILDKHVFDRPIEERA